MCGAERSSAMVAMMVKSVNVMRQSLSSTIAANFQSFSMAAVSSSSRILGNSYMSSAVGGGRGPHKADKKNEVVLILYVTRG